MPGHRSTLELTARGFLLATLLTSIFTAANVYLGLKIGLTFATSIPAAVISMAILRLLKDSTILENNIVQTITSAAGTLASIVFIIPALVMIGVWQDFPLWQVTFLCAIGGIYGVMFTIPLRRALVVESDLPYPEGTAAAQVLKVGQAQRVNKEDDHPIKDIVIGSVLAFSYSLFSKGFNILASKVSYFTRIGDVVSGAGVSYAYSLIGAGYLVGLHIGTAILIGTIISWFIAVPIFSYHHIAQVSDLTTFALTIWTDKVRYIGVGTIGVAAIWAIAKLAMPVYRGIRNSIQTTINKRRGGIDNIPIQERDIPIVWVALTSALMILPLTALFGYFIFANQAELPASLVISLVLLCVFLAVGLGFIVAAVSGYMAGLVGSSNSPISGIGILAIIIVSLILTYFFQHTNEILNGQHIKHIVALAVFTTSAVLAMASISNDNLQDLKTGHLVGATPWKQQISLIFGVCVGSLVVAPVLNQLYQAYGFAGALPREGMDPSLALSAPQATLMTMLARGIIGTDMDWNLIFIGAGIGIIAIAINELIILRRGLPTLSTLSIGIGIYLPPEINIPIFIGSLLSYFITKSNHRGTLFACGLIVGDSLFGILLAGIITMTGTQQPLALVTESFKPIANWLGTFVFFAGYVYFYYYTKNHRQNR